MEQSILSIFGDYWFWGGLGFILGSALCVRNMVKNHCAFPIAVIAITVGIYFGMIATRLLWLAIFSPWIFTENLPLALAFWQDTGTWLGAPLGGLLGISLVLKLSKQPIWSNLGGCGSGLALAHGIARMGCLVAGCCYGAPATVPWAIYSKYLGCKVHPAPLYSILGELISLILLQSLWPNKKLRPYLYPGYILLLSIHRFASEFFRGDNPGPELIAGLRVYQVICIFLFAIALGLMAIVRWRKKGILVLAVLLCIPIAMTILLRPTVKITAEKNEGRVLVLTRSIFKSKLRPWILFRQRQGYRLTVKDWLDPPDANEVTQWITQRAANASEPVVGILIIGDFAGDEPLRKSQWHMPSVEHSFETYINKKKKVSYISDIPYGDIDGDGRADIAVGRLAVRTKGQLQKQIRKIIAYEKQPATGGWYRAVIWAGAKGYMPQIDRIVRHYLAMIPDWIEPVVLCGDVNSIYAGNIAEQPSLFLEQLRRPAMLNVISAHGSWRHVTPAVYQGREIFLAVEDLANFSSEMRTGPLVLIGCDSGRFDTNETAGPSLAETFSGLEHGPAAVIAASGPTNPLTNYFITRAMLKGITERPKTVGDFALHLQQNIFDMADGTLKEMAQGDKFAESLIGAAPPRLDPTMAEPSLARNEVLMYNLLGDPLCVMKNQKE